MLQFFYVIHMKKHLKQHKSTKGNRYEMLILLTFAERFDIIEENKVGREYPAAAKRLWKASVIAEHRRGPLGEE